MNGSVSPRLGLRFELERGELRGYGPDGRLRRRPDEIAQELAQQRQRAEQASAKRDVERARAEQLAAKLGELGLDPEAPPAPEG